jgi:hypothetical protein
MYDADSYLVASPLNRYVRSSRDDLKYGEDGSLTLYIQHASPSKKLKANWLPTPEGEFNLALRLYWPKATVLDGPHGNRRPWHGSPDVSI